MTVEHITVMKATNADVYAIWHGKSDEMQVMSVPERREDSYPVYVRRLYEPVEVIELPEPMESDGIGGWINESRDHPKLEPVDFDSWEERTLLQTIVENRRNYMEFLRDLYDDLDSIVTDDTMAQKGIGEVKKDIEEGLSAYAVEVDEVEPPEEEDIG